VAVGRGTQVFGVRALQVNWPSFGRQPPLGSPLFEYRPYQIDGINRAVDRGSLLLAMTMGSGKTATAIGTVMELRRQKKVVSGLILAPNSLKFQWQAELRKVDPGTRSLVVDGSKAQRVAQYRHAKRFHYVITNYESVVNDWESFIKYVPLDFIIADEATAIKSFNAKRSRKVKLLGKRCNHRLALSGQPVENRPEELFSIMEFVDPTVLGTFQHFDRTYIERDHFGRPKKYHNLNRLHDAIQPVMFRKSREDIKEWLPEVVSMEIPIPLDNKVLALHNYIRSDLLAALDRAAASGTNGFDLAAHYGRGSNQDQTLKGEVMARLTCMRMLASHPQLLLNSAADFDDDATKSGSKYASQLKLSGMLVGLPTTSPKMNALMEMIEEITDEDPLNKVVVFSFFKPMLALMETELRKRRIGHTKITGDVESSERFRRIKSFNNDAGCRVFLSSDAGAYGVDLNRGSHLINYDLPWSAGVLSQRVSRIDRTSSSFSSITIGYLYGRDTIEERMLRMLKDKLAVAGAFLDGKYDLQSGSLPLDFQSLKAFLLEG